MSGSFKYAADVHPTVQKQLTQRRQYCQSTLTQAFSSFNEDETDEQQLSGRTLDQFSICKDLMVGHSSGGAMWLIAPKFSYQLMPAASAISEEQRAIASLTGQIFERTRAAADVQRRLDELQFLANDEGMQMDERSRACLSHFLGAITCSKAPKIYLQDSGSLRAVWRSQDEQVALEFLPNGVIRYVLFATRPRPLQVARNAGIDNTSHILEHLNHMGLSHLLNG